MISFFSDAETVTYCNASLAPRGRALSPSCIGCFTVLMWTLILIKSPCCGVGLRCLSPAFSDPLTILSNATDLPKRKHNRTLLWKSAQRRLQNAIYFFAVLQGNHLSLHHAGACLSCSQRPSEDSYSHLTGPGWNYSSDFGFLFEHNF